MFGNKNKEKEGDKQLRSAVHNNSVVSNGVVLDGNLISLGAFRFDGRMTGRIICQDKVVIGQDGVVKGDIIAQHVDVYGTIIGTIEVTGILTLKTNCNVKGDMSAQKIVMEEGSAFDGNCKMHNLQYPEALKEIDKMISDGTDNVLIDKGIGYDNGL